MNEKENEAGLRYKVVANPEDQYSIWPANQPNPPGWRDVGKTGDKVECLEYIKSAWTEMRPRSLQNNMPDPNQAT